MSITATSAPHARETRSLSAEALREEAASPDSIVLAARRAAESAPPMTDVRRAGLARLLKTRSEHG